MIAFIKGIVTDISADTIVVENNGIGYEIFVPGSVQAEFRGTGQEVKIHTYMYVREDAMNLYGFLTKEDLRVFKLLITVNGIGPKGALAVLSVMSSDDLKFAVLSGDSKSISKAPGVGAKTAQRVIIDLKDKFNLEDTFEGDLSTRSGNEIPASDNKAEAVMALVALGYNETEAARAIRNSAVTPDMDSDEILKIALRTIMTM